MQNRSTSRRKALPRPTVVIAVTLTFLAALPTTQAKPNLEGKVVLANVTKYKATFRIGKVQKEVAPGKASLLSPKKFPISFQLWSGKTNIGWQETSVTQAGIYTLRVHKGQWSLSQHTSRKATATTVTRTTRAGRPSQRVTYKTRSTGTRSRVVQRSGGGRIARRSVGGRSGGNYWTPIERGIWAAASIYRFVRDEQDRDLIRRAIVGREIDDAVRREVEDRLRAVNLPADQRRELERAWDELSRVSDEDWKEIENLPADKWDEIRDRLGDEISDDDWQGLQAELLDASDNVDVSTADLEEMSEVGVEDLEQAVDIDELGVEDLADSVEDMDVGDLALDAEELDVGDLGVGDWDAVGVDDGGWREGGSDAYDYGDYDWGGGDLGGDDWGGGDWGGGDDFGGGFDDFGGGFDFFD